MSQPPFPRPTVTPPSVFASNEPGAFLEALRSPWYALVGDLHDVFVTTTTEYARSRGLKNLHLPLTTRTITCPTALGSDAEPVPVKILGVDTYLPDSMQFLLGSGRPGRGTVATGSVGPGCRPRGRPASVRRPSRSRRSARAADLRDAEARLGGPSGRERTPAGRELVRRMLIAREPGPAGRAGPGAPAASVHTRAQPGPASVP